jgi:cytoskeletal protein RodZ
LAKFHLYLDVDLYLGIVWIMFYIEENEKKPEKHPHPHTQLYHTTAQPLRRTDMSTLTSKSSSASTEKKKSSVRKGGADYSHEHAGVIHVSGRIAAQQRVVLGSKRKAVRVAVNSTAAGAGASDEGIGEEDMLTITPLGAGFVLLCSCAESRILLPSLSLSLLNSLV